MTDVALVLDGAAAAREAGLRYVTDDQPGLRRRRAGRGFVYLDTAGRPIRDAAVIERIRKIVIPPAWTDVWICPSAWGHIQATGRDARGRKQYRYHVEWRRVRDEAKFCQLEPFAHALPQIRARTELDMRAPGIPREKVLAAMVRLLEITLIRIGNEEYARANRSYGLTTLREGHVDIRGSELSFTFRGKSGVRRRVTLRDSRLAHIVKRCRDIPGYELFMYMDESGESRVVDSGDVNDYIREIGGDTFTAKCFRTWGATVFAAAVLGMRGAPRSERAAKAQIRHAMERTADHLGNTPTVCRKSYVHPAVLEAYVTGELATAMTRHASVRVRATSLTGAERAVLRVLERATARAARQKRAAA